MPRQKILVAIVGLALGLATIGTFLPTLANSFIEFDDPGYVTRNYHVRRGLSWETVTWAFATAKTGNWHPLTWLSHALDCQIYGLNPLGHHLTSILLHTANTLLLFMVLRRATGALWRSALVAALFGLHPLRVESVSWAAERKDVLSGLFFMLTLWAYLKHVSSVRCQVSGVEAGSWVRKQGAEAECGIHPTHRVSCITFHVSRFYVLALLFFALGLISKPMVVTLPLVLLVLDYWPLRRVQSSKFKVPTLRLVFEKLPFFILAVVVGIVTMIVQKRGGNLESLPLSFRVSHAAVSYLSYCAKTLWPHHLAVFYPRPPQWPAGLVIGGVLLLAAAGVLAFWQRHRRPYLLTGWLWYLVMLLPVCGLVAIGAHEVANRYTYLPGIGLLLIAVWAGADLVQGRRYGKMVLAGMALVALMACGLSTLKEQRYWRTDKTLFERAYQTTSSNYVACIHLASALAAEGERTRALEYCRSAVAMHPNGNDGWNQMAVLLAEQGRMQEALSAANTAIRVEPEFAAEAYHNRGTIWQDLGNDAAAITDLEKTLQLDPEHLGARINLANLLAKKGEFNAAARHYQAALQLDPQHALAHYDLANLLARSGQPAQAVAHYERSLQLSPTNAAAHSNLGLLLLQDRKADAALERFREALRLAPALVQAHYGMALALRDQGRPAEAVSHLKQALQPNPDFPAALAELARLCATCPDAAVRNGAGAVIAAERLCKLSGNKSAPDLSTLAAAYAEAGDFRGAVAAAERAIELAQVAGQKEVEDKGRRLLELFRAGQPFREPVISPPAAR